MNLLLKNFKSNTVGAAALRVVALNQVTESAERQPERGLEPFTSMVA